jgi:transposase
MGKNNLLQTAQIIIITNGIQVFLNDGRIKIDNNPAEHTICLNVIGRKNWLFSVSEVGAEANANAICLSIVETAKANGVDFYQYLMKLLTDLPNLESQQYEINICPG